VFVAWAAVEHPAADKVVAVAEDVGLDFDDIADDCFDCKAAAVYLWRYTFDYYTLASIWVCGDTAHRCVLIFLVLVFIAL
jgi:hypothetical protein